MYVLPCFLFGDFYTITCITSIFYNFLLAPEGMAIPVLKVINDMTLRVSWLAPDVANGEVTGYNIHINNKVIPTNMKLPGSFVVTGLLPYTIYSVKVISYNTFVVYSNLT